MTTSMRMEQDQSHMTERILNLTLEIIYVLTGEDYKVVKKLSGEPLTLNQSLQRTSPITMSPSHYLATEVTSGKKILEATKKIIELLTGEVPIRCQDVTVYFSMEEWEYLEGHKDLYKDVMMASQPALTSPDGSSNGNPPERCPHPLYSHRDSTQEDLTISHMDINFNKPIKEEDDEVAVMVKISEEHKEPFKIVIMEPFDDANSPERCPRPLYSRDYTQEDLTIPHYHLSEELKDIKIEVKEEEEERLVSGDQPSMEEEMIIISKEEESSLRMDTNGRYVWNQKTSKGRPVLSPYSSVEDNKIAQYSSGVNPAGKRTPYHRTHHSEKSMTASNLGESSTSVTPGGLLRSTDPSSSKQSSSNHERVHKGETSLSSLECEKSFNEYITLLSQQSSHKSERPFPCSECGKCFITKGNLLKHQRIHSGVRPFSCSECGKSFIYNRDLIIHQRGHIGERNFTCSDCGKSYIQRADLLKHQRIHTGRYPYSCSECGKCFHRKGKLLEHQRSHTGERPFSCSECGKGFFRKADLLIHQKIHTGERPFSCSECGKCFIKKGALIIHQRTHTGERPFSCSVCGKGFTHKGNLTSHQRTHNC